MDAFLNNHCEDGEEWMPSDLRIALKLDLMPVIPYEDEIKTDIIEDCYASKHVGITCVKKQGGESSFLVCLTTEDKIYVIDTKYESNTHFLEGLLKEQNNRDLKFYVYKGHESAFRLKSGYAIDIGSVIDLSTLDIFLSMRQLIKTGAVKSYNVTSLLEQKIKYRDRISLTLEYLQVELPEPTREEQLALSLKPLNFKAQNAIRKMAATTRMVAISIQQKIDSLTFADSENIYSFGPRASDDDLAASENLDGRSYQKILCRLNQLRPENGTQ